MTDTLLLASANVKNRSVRKRNYFFSNPPPSVLTHNPQPLKRANTSKRHIDLGEKHSLRKSSSNAQKKFSECEPKRASEPNKSKSGNDSKWNSRNKNSVIVSRIL